MGIACESPLSYAETLGTMLPIRARFDASVLDGAGASGDGDLGQCSHAAGRTGTTVLDSNRPPTAPSASSGMGREWSVATVS